MISNLNPIQSEEDLEDALIHQSDRALIGRPPNHWLYSSSPPVFDLTRPIPPRFALPSPNTSVTFTTTTTPITISPSITALVIIDMQNFFLSSCVGRPEDSAGNKAKQVLLQTAIPAARKAGVRVIWLNWGLIDDDIDSMPPSTRRAFGFEASSKNATGPNSATVPRARDTADASGLAGIGKPKRIYKGLGSEIGPVQLEDGSVVDGGKLLMRDTWNAALPPALDLAYQHGRNLDHAPDVWIHKNRMTGLWGATSPCTNFLEQEGIRTLLFAGVNTDQCVAGSMQDALTKGWDCVLLRDACGTTSPAFATESVEWNCARSWGFVADCTAFEQGAERMLEVRSARVRV